MADTQNTLGEDKGSDYEDSISEISTAVLLTQLSSDLRELKSEVRTMNSKFDDAIYRATEQSQSIKKLEQKNTELENEVQVLKGDTASMKT